MKTAEGGTVTLTTRERRLRGVLMTLGLASMLLLFALIYSSSRSYAGAVCCAIGFFVIAAEVDKKGMKGARNWMPWTLPAFGVSLLIIELVSALMKW